MPSITLSIPEDVYRRMKRHSQVKWSEVALRAILEYLRRLEGVVSTDELLERLGQKFAEELDEIGLEEMVEQYKRRREDEWRRLSMI